MSRRSTRRVAGAIVGLSLLAVANAVTSGQSIATVPVTLAWFAIGATVFFGGAFLLGAIRMGRSVIAAVVASLLPVVLASSVVSGLLSGSEALAAIGIGVALFALTFGFVFVLLGRNPISHG